MIEYTENNIAAALAMQFFNKKHLVVVPNCNWTGYECDLLTVTNDLRIIDVEIKISRPDFKADAKKDKWIDRQFKGYAPETKVYDGDGRLKMVRRPALYDETRRVWPPKVWKHYYVMPEEIWTPELLQAAGSEASGILLLSEYRGGIRVRTERPAKANRAAEKLSPSAAIDIARLASLRMWNAVTALQQTRRAA